MLAVKLYSMYNGRRVVKFSSVSSCSHS